MIAAYHNNKDIVDLLMNCGAKVNARHKSEKKALHLVSMKGNVVFWRKELLSMMQTTMETQRYIVAANMDNMAL